jgi:hypothetical protein
MQDELDRSDDYSFRITDSWTHLVFAIDVAQQRGEVCMTLSWSIVRTVAAT